MEISGRRGADKRTFPVLVIIPAHVLLTPRFASLSTRREIMFKNEQL
jgi:hypothetical protein